MDMKKILQAVDGIATKPVEGADSMAHFLRVVKEAEINQQFPPVAPLPQLKVPPIPQLTAQDGDLGNGSRVTTNADGTRSYSSGMGTFTYDAQGKAITYTSPKMSGYGQTIDLATNQIVHDYHAGPLQLNYKADAQGRPITSRAKYDLGVATLGHDNDHVSGIRSTEVAPRVGDGSDTAATLAMAHKIMPTSDIAAARGVDPKKFAAFQKQNPTAVNENSLSKFLSIVDKSNVNMLSEGVGPHRVALPVQMAMQHYQQHRETPQPRERLINKYFTEAEAEITQRQEEKRAKINQYASVIAERVLMKGSKKKILNEGTLEVLKPDGKSDDYNSVQFRIDGKTVERGSEDFDYYYKLVFKKNPPGGKDDFIDTLKGMMDKDYGSMDADPMKDSENDVQNGDAIIPSHPKPKGKWVKISDIVEAMGSEVDPNKLTASMLMGGEYKELDLTPLIAKNNWVGTPKQVIFQADWWLRVFLRQRGTMYSNLKIKYKGLTLTSSKIGDVDASDTEFESIAGVGLQSIDELSTEFLGKYKKAAGADAKKHKELAESRTDYTAEEMADMLTGKRTQKQVDADAEKTRGPDKGKPKKESLDQLLALRNKIDEAIKQRLDPKCWTGKHKKGTKTKGGVRVNNCVPNKK